MKIVRCNFKNITEEKKEKLKESQCLLLISVGQEAHEGDRFAATVELIKSSFESCIISIYDSIQRHTMALNSVQSPDFFHDKANREGKLWYERNMMYISQLPKLKRIYHWDHWLNHKLFQTKKNEIISLMEQDIKYKSVFDLSIETYLNRYIKNSNDSPTFNRERAKKICLEYIIEECAVLILWIELACQFEIYPNKHNMAIEETRKRFILPGHSNILQPLTLRFKNAKQPKRQVFRSLEVIEDNFS